MNWWHIPEAERRDKKGYKVKINSDCVDSYHSDEEFGEWSNSYSNSFESIRRKRDKEEIPDVVTDLDIPAGEECFVVWLEYSTGDSFGYSSFGGTEVVGLFKDYDAANELKNHVESTRGADYPFDGSRIKYVAKDGQNIDVYYGTWTGYFEHLEIVHIEKTWMQE